MAAFCLARYEATCSFFTKKGMAKRAALSEFETRSKKLAACGLKEGDELLAVVPDNGEESVLLVTKKAMSIRFAADAHSPNGPDGGGGEGHGARAGRRGDLCPPGAPGRASFCW